MSEPEPDEGCCTFDPYPDSPGEESYQYRRECTACGSVWWSNHCVHDGVQRACRECGWRPPGSRTPMEFLGFAAPPGA